MHIEVYSYGKMVIDGKTYTKDLIIFPQKIKPDWWRKEGHSLAVEDLEEVIHHKPEVLVVGKGDSGFMQVPQETKSALKGKGIEVITSDTHKAVKIFNIQAAQNKNVVGAFHLTC